MHTALRGKTQDLEIFASESLIFFDYNIPRELQESYEDKLEPSIYEPNTKNIRRSWKWQRNYPNSCNQ